MITSIIQGVTFGACCTGVVAVIGVTFVSPRSDTGYFNTFGEMWKTFLRGVLGIASIAAAGLGLLLACRAANPAVWQVYLSWLVTYSVGLCLYFAVRYGRYRESKKQRDKWT